MRTVLLSEIEDANFNAFTGHRNDLNYMRRGTPLCRAVASR